LRAEVMPAIQLALGRAPVVLLAPGVAEIAHVGEIRAVVPARALDLIGPARRGEPAAQVLPDGLVHADLEALERGVLGGHRRAFIHMLEGAATRGDPHRTSRQHRPVRWAGRGTAGSICTPSARHWVSR